jgi:predicted acetyltransferase
MLLVEPLTDGTPVRKGMARVVDAKPLLELYAACYPSVQLCIRLHDEVVRPNAGYYRIADGHCIHSLKPLEGAQEMTVAELTAFLFAQERPFMNLMLE